MTSFKKHIDNRYISGENLKFGIEEQKGLKPEMVVYFHSFNDGDTYDQQKQEKIIKHVIYFTDCETGEKLKKGVLMNKSHADFLKRELAGGKDSMEEIDKNTPFVLFAEPHRRFGYVARFKKYFAPQVSDKRAIDLLNNSKDLAKTWTTELTQEERAINSVLNLKNKLKDAKI